MHRGYYAIIPAIVRYDTELKPNAKLLYGEISALANESGYCWAANQYFADLYNVNDTTISKWISQLVSKGYIMSERLYKENKRHLYIPDATTVMVEGYLPKGKDLLSKRERGSCQKGKEVLAKKESPNNIYNNTLNNTFNNGQSDLQNDQSKDDPEAEFEILWKKYPNKKKKKDALRHYKRERKTTTFEAVNKGLDSYITYINHKGLPTQYIQHGSTWFNGRGWEDEYEVGESNEINSGITTDSDGIKRDALGNRIY